MSEVSVIQMLKSGQQDLAWFGANLQNLIAKYNNKFIAFHNKTVIDSDKKIDDLMNKLKERNIDTSNILIKFISKVKTLL